MKEIKKQKQKNSYQGFWAQVCLRIHRPMYAGQLYAYACKKHAFTNTPQNPNPKTQKHKNKEKTKIKETNNLTCFKIESY